MKAAATKFFKDYFKVHEQDMVMYDDTIDCMVKFAEKVSGQGVSRFLLLLGQMIKEENESLGKFGFYNRYNREAHAINKYCLAIVKSLIERRYSVIETTK